MLQERQFRNSFWGNEDKGLDQLMSRMKQSRHTCEEVCSLFKERANIEEDYGKRLAKLAKNFSPKEELGTLRDSLDVVRAELEASAKVHMDIASEIKSQLEKPLIEFINTQYSIRKNHQNNMEKLLKAKNQLHSSVNKTKERYTMKCLEQEQLTQQNQQNLPSKEQEKIKIKLDKVNASVNQVDLDYQNGVEKLQELHVKWQSEFTSCCNDCQKLEEDKIDFLRSHVWDYANLLSTGCVADDESFEKIRLSLEKCEIAKDVQLVLDKFSTGSEIPKPLSYVNYYGIDKKLEKTISIQSWSKDVMPKAKQEKQRPRVDEPSFFYDPFEVPDDTNILFIVRVLYDYQSQASEELTITKGETIPVFATHEDGWWEGIVVDSKTSKKRKGLFPSNFVEAA